MPNYMNFGGGGGISVESGGIQFFAFDSENISQNKGTLYTKQPASSSNKNVTPPPPHPPSAQKIPKK